MHWLHLTCDALLLLSYFVLALLLVGWIRRRHDESLAALFILYGSSLAVRGVFHFLVVLFWWTKQIEADSWWMILLLLGKFMCVLTFVPAVAMFTYLTPRVMRIPSVQELSANMSHQLIRIHDLDTRLKTGKTLKKTERTLLDTQAELASALATIKSLRGE